MSDNLKITISTIEQVPALNQLIKHSAKELSRGFYTDIETAAAIDYVFGVDTALIKDGSYFTATINGELAGCGGWSRRRTMYGGDQRPIGDADLLDPNKDAARIRAFFIAPQAARKGVAKAIFEACQAAAKAYGFQRLELMATLPGVPFYSAIGFQKIEDKVDVLPNGVPLAFVFMQKSICII